MSLLETIQSEKSRITKAMLGKDPLSEEYRQGIENLSALVFLEDHESLKGDAAGVPAPGSTPTPEPEPEPAPTPEPTEPIPDISHVRERLAELKQKGVSIKDLLGEFGAKNLSGVAPSDYNALLRRAEELAEEVSGS